MGTNRKVTLVIYLVHGEPLKFEVELTQAKEFGLGKDIEQGLSRNAMAIEAEGKLYLIPYSNIRYVECSPIQDVLPQNMIRDAKRILS
jgi:hypothetical protein